MSLRTLLAPFVPLYRMGLAMRELRLRSGREPVRRLRLPVVSVGNLSTGGSGKTPLVITLARALKARGAAVDVLSRGYGRSGKTAVRVDPAGSAEDFGDEPLLIARSADVPVYVSPQRYDAGALAEDTWNGNEPAIHILDDGFQHRQLYRDIDILLLSREDVEDRLLPQGNLREELHAAGRAQVIAIPAGDQALEERIRERGFKCPIWRLHRRMDVPSLAGPVLGFCGIARPGQFFAGLEAAGARLAARRAFADHHRYTQDDLDRLAIQASAAGASALLTTEKDAVRLRGLQPVLPIHTVELQIEIDDGPAALDWLLSRLTSMH